MTDAIFEAIATGVDSVVSGAVLMIFVYILGMNTKISKYSSMQETYSKAVTYYREFNAFDCASVHTADVIAASATYSNGIAIYGIFVDKSTSTAYLYKRADGKWTKANATYSVSTGKVSFGSVNTDDDEVLIKAMREANWSTTIPASDLYSISADFMGKSYLLEDLTLKPSVPYRGGTVTGIYFRLER